MWCVENWCGYCRKIRLRKYLYLSVKTGYGREDDFTGRRFFIILALSLTLCTLGAIVAQPSEEWEKTFGGSKDDCGYSVQQTSDGGYIVAGDRDRYYDASIKGTTSSDVWLIKTSPNGTEEWNRIFSASNNERGESVQQTSDGGYIIAGWTLGTEGDGDAWLIKIDSSGNEEWNKTFGGSNSDESQSVQQTSGGGYIIAGFTSSFGAGEGDVWLIKTDSTGNKLWDRTIGGSEFDRGQSVQQTSDGGYIVTGYTNSFGAGEGDVWLIKTDSHGNKVWDKTFGGFDSDYGRSVQQTSDGGYIVAGYTYSLGAGIWDGWLIKTDSAGNKLWDRTIGGSESDYDFSVQQTSDDGYIVTGYTHSFGAGGGDVWLIKTDSAGNEVWNKTFGGSDSNGARDVKETSDGGYILTGWTTSHDAGGTDLWLIKVAPISGTMSSKVAQATVTSKIAPEVEDETSEAPSGAAGPDASGDENRWAEDAESLTIGELAGIMMTDPESIVDEKVTTEGFVYVSTHKASEGVWIMSNLLGEILGENAKYLDPAYVWNYCFGFDSMIIVSTAESDQAYDYGCLPSVQAYGGDEDAWPEAGSVVRIEGSMEKRSVLWKEIGHIFKVDEFLVDKSYSTYKDVARSKEGSEVKMMAVINESRMLSDNTYHYIAAPDFDLYLKIPEMDLPDISLMEIEGTVTYLEGEGGKTKRLITVDDANTVLSV